MRRVFRMAVRGGLVLVLATAVVLVLTLTLVDRRPLAGGGLARRAEERVRALGSEVSGPALALDFRAGFGRARLTPVLGAAVDDPERGEFRRLPLAGYGNRAGRPATGVHDDLWVKAVAFANSGRTGVMVAADALIIPREVTELAEERIRAGCGLVRDSIYFGATHSHCSLGGWGEGMVGEAFAGRFQPGVRIWMARQLAAAVCSAVTNLASASVAAGSFDAPDLTRNRLVGEAGRIDPEFSLLWFRQAGGGTALIGSFSAHATVLSGGMMEYSADYPGYWQRIVEERTGGMAMFMAAGVGSHAPKPPKGGLEGAQEMGERLADRTLKEVGGMNAGEKVVFDLRTLEVELPELQARITDGIRLRPWVARRLLPVHSTTWLQAVRFGDRVWFSTPCDYSGEMALDLKAAGRKLGLRVNVTSFNGDYVGYVIPARHYHLDTYETRTMGFFGPQLPDYFAGLLENLLTIMAGLSGKP